MSCPTPVIRRPTDKLSGRWVPYVPHDPSLEMPDEGRTTGRLTGILIRPQASNRASPAGSLLSTLVRALTGLKQSATHPA
jgi:hypothetical protein